MDTLSEPMCGVHSESRIVFHSESRIVFYSESRIVFHSGSRLDVHSGSRCWCSQVGQGVGVHRWAKVWCSHVVARRRPQPPSLVRLGVVLVNLTSRCEQTKPTWGKWK